MARFVFSAFADEASPNVLEQIEECKKNGVYNAELRNVDGKNISDFSVEEAKKLKKTLDEGGLKVSSLGSGYGKTKITDDFAPSFEKFKNTVEVAKILGAKYIRIFSFYFTNVEKYEDYKDEAFSRLSAMARYAKENGVLCCHENEKGIYGDNIERNVEIFERVGSDLGCVFDPANFIQCGVKPLDAFEKLKDRITYLHIKDCDADGSIVPAGEGVGNIEEILRALNENEKVYFLSAEPHLRVFEGLDALEAGGESARKSNEKFVYPDNKTSFKAACSAIRAVTEKIRPLRFGVVGVGNMGTSHLRMYAEGKLKELRVVACADVNPERLTAAKEIIPEIKTFDSAEALIDSGEVDAVIIATPHYFHPPIAKYAFKKGLHVLTEKPAGVYAKQVMEMNEAAEKSGRVFGIMFNQRTNCVYRKAREMVRSGELGEIRRVNWLITDWYRPQSYYNSGGWRATWAGEGGGVLLNQCPHNLDLWQWICGMPVKIRAFCGEGKWHDIEVEDDVSIYAEYANGATGVFISSTGDYPGDNRLEITLDGGTLVCEREKLRLFKLNERISDHCAGAQGGFEKLKGEWIDVETDGLNKQHAEVTNRFAAAVLRGEELVARGEEGLRSLSISNAAHLSSWLGKEVELPVDPDLYYSELQKKIISGTAEKKNVKAQIQKDMSSTF